MERLLLSEIIDFIDNRDIYIVSSGVPLDGVVIEGAPVLVRLNSSRRWGDCDIWFNNQSQDPKFQHDSQGSGGERFIIRANGDNKGANMRRNFPTEWAHTYFWPVEDWETMTEEMQVPRPLTGTIAAYWFHKYTTSKLFLINYDFYETNKRHTVRNIPQPAPVHKPWLDKAYLETLDRIEYSWITP